jgi:hypothetical protein
MTDYDSWLLRGSGAYTTEKEVKLTKPCPVCGGTEGTLVKDDFGLRSLWCDGDHGEHGEQAANFELDPIEFLDMEMDE